ncbi:YlcI/YnfO family protein [Sinorhizobium fredii]|uniref:YlcI/YnfO family protein n=1 Tax=Rhizobium fredii TaxID=380 RepID=UPI0013045BC2|nr:YlcI/YnfO family protein [Sinorhizobium fredii]
MGRKKTNFEQMPARFPDGTFERIDAVLEPDETRTDFLRGAVEREIKRRAKAKRAED